MPDIQTSAQLPKYSSAPSSPVLGDIYFDTTDNEPKVYVTIGGTSKWLGLGQKTVVQAYTPGS